MLCSFEFLDFFTCDLVPYFSAADLVPQKAPEAPRLLLHRFVSNLIIYDCTKSKLDQVTVTVSGPGPRRHVHVRNGHVKACECCRP